MKWIGWTLTVALAMAGSAALSEVIAFQYLVGVKSAWDAAGNDVYSTTSWCS